MGHLEACITKPNTFRAYVQDIRKFLDHYGEGQALMLTPDQLNLWVKTVQERNGLKASSLARHVATLKRFFEWASRAGLAPANTAIAIRKPKVPRSLPRFLTKEEIELFLGAVDNPRDYCIAELLFGCGFRISELLSLTVAQVVGSQGSLRIMGKGQKERIVPMGTFAQVAIANYVPYRMQRLGNLYDHGRLFINFRDGQPLQSRSVPRILQNIAEKAGLKKEFAITPHVFRHSYATALMNRGMDMLHIKELLGHESLRTTQIYTHVAHPKLEEAFRKAHPRA